MTSSVSSSSRLRRSHLSAARFGNACPAKRAFSLRIAATRFRCWALSSPMAAGPSALRLLLSHLGPTSPTLRPSTRRAGRDSAGSPPPRNGGEVMPIRPPSSRPAPGARHGQSLRGRVAGGGSRTTSGSISAQGSSPVSFGGSVHRSTFTQSPKYQKLRRSHLSSGASGLSARLGGMTSALPPVWGGGSSGVASRQRTLPMAASSASPILRRIRVLVWVVAQKAPVRRTPRTHTGASDRRTHRNACPLPLAGGKLVLCAGPRGSP
jgi:hypothetical protein